MTLQTLIPRCYNTRCFLEPSGGVVDDLMVYYIKANEYLLVVNASNTDKDFKWLSNNLGSFDVKIENVSGFYGQIALQGPLAKDILEAIIKTSSKLPFMHFDYFEYEGNELLISRSGYTGEDGFEIYASKAQPLLNCSMNCS